MALKLDAGDEVLSNLTRREALRLLGVGAFVTASAPMSAFGQGAGAEAPSFPKGAIIRTLFKDYAPEELASGATLFHEHLSSAPIFPIDFARPSAAVLAAQGLPQPAGPSGPPPAAPGPDPMRDVSLMTEELRKARSEGISCIVDAGLEGAGVDIKFIRQAAQQSGLAVVKGAGFYTEPFYPKDIGKMSEEQITRALIRQCDEYPLARSAKSAPGMRSLLPSARCFVLSARLTWPPTCRSLRTPASRKVGDRAARCARRRGRGSSTGGYRAPGESQRSRRLRSQDLVPAGRLHWLRSTRQRPG